MDQAVRRMRLLGLPVSLRKASYSRAVLRGLKFELGADWLAGPGGFEPLRSRMGIRQDSQPRRRDSNLRI